MPKVHIVTDSTAHFRQTDYAAKHHITVVPLTIHFGKESFQEGIDLDSTGFFDKLATNASLPTVASPTPEAFTATYESIAKAGDSIVSIHLSSKLGRVHRNARLGSEPLMGRCNVQVIDSATTSVGLGHLVEAAVEAAEAGESADEIVRIVRGLIPRLYIVFFVETLANLAHNKRFNRAQAVLGNMLGIKPFLSIEDGDIVAMEKVRSRAHAVEKLAEFVSEFHDLQHLAILQSTPHPTDDTRMLLEQLAIDFPDRQFPIMVYGPSLGTLLGAEAMGVIVYEGNAYAD